MTTMHKHPLWLAISLALIPLSSTALEIDPHVAPQVNFGGQALVTVQGRERNTRNDGSDRDASLDFADSSLLLGFSKYLFDSESYGFGVIGFKVLEDEDDADIRDDIYLHQLHAGIGGRHYELKLGRSNLPNSLVNFPTLRDDDLLAYTHIGNAFSAAPDEVYQLYGGQVSATGYLPSLRLAATASTVARTETDDNGQRLGSERFNSSNLKLAWEIPEAIKFDLGLRYLAVSWDRQELRSPARGAVNAYQLGTSINLNSHPEASWHLDMQGTWVDGISTPDLTGANAARASQTSVVSALRYVHAPWLQTRWQAALTAGWQEYRNHNNARSYTLAPSLNYRIGSGVELLAQYQFREDSQNMPGNLRTDHRIQLGLSFSFDHVLNKHMGSRNSIMQLEHNMLDIGPAMGGH